MASSISFDLFVRKRKITFVPYLPSIFGTDLFSANFVGKDGVHLTETGSKIFHEAIADMVRSIDAQASIPHTLHPSIPMEVTLSQWIVEFRKRNLDSLPPIVPPPLRDFKPVYKRGYRGDPRKGFKKPRTK